MPLYHPCSKTSQWWTTRLENIVYKHSFERISAKQCFILTLVANRIRTDTSFRCTEMYNTPRDFIALQHLAKLYTRISTFVSKWPITWYNTEKI